MNQTHPSRKWKGWRRPLSRWDDLDAPMPHRASCAEVQIHGDTGVPRAKHAVGAEVAVVDVSHADVAAAVGARDRDGPPHDGV